MLHRPIGHIGFQPHHDIEIDVIDTATFSRKHIESLGYVAHELTRMYPAFQVVPRSSFKLDPSLVRATKDGIKKTTVRYSRGAVEYPIAPMLPMMIAPRNRSSQKPIGIAQIVALTYKPFFSLDTVDAFRDGFESKTALKDRLIEFYGPIKDYEPICIFSLVFENARPVRDAMSFGRCHIDSIF